MNCTVEAGGAGRAGYTLLEVLLATLLCGGGLVAVLSAYTHAVHSTGEVTAILQGNAALQAQADLLLPGLKAARGTERSEDVCGEPYAGFRWRLEQSDLLAADHLCEVTLSVWRKGSQAQREVRTWVLRTGK